MAKGNDIDLENISMKKWKCEKKRVNKRKTKIIMGGKEYKELFEKMSEYWNSSHWVREKVITE